MLRSGAFGREARRSEVCGRGREPGGFYELRGRGVNAEIYCRCSVPLAPVIAGLVPPVQRTPLPPVAVRADAVAVPVTVHVVPAQVSPIPDDRRVPVMVSALAFSDPATSSVPPELVPVPVTDDPVCVRTSVTAEVCGVPPAMNVRLPVQVPLRFRADGELVLLSEPHALRQSKAQPIAKPRLLMAFSPLVAVIGDRGSTAAGDRPDHGARKFVAMWWRARAETATPLIGTLGGSRNVLSAQRRS